MNNYATSQLAPFLVSGYPVSSKTEGKQELTFLYKGPTALLKANEPEVGDPWVGDEARKFFNPETTSTSDLELVVVRSLRKPIEDMDTGRQESDVLHMSTLEVTAGSLAGGAYNLSTRREKMTYGLRWVAVELPLETHKKFRPEGLWELTQKDLLHIAGWRAETDLQLKVAMKYILRDGDGNPKGGIQTIPPTSNAYKFVLLLQRGFDAWEKHLPVWSRRSTYRGFLPPETDDLGAKETPPGPMRATLKAAYQWRKCTDDLQSTTDTNRWEREEAWQGADKVFIDKNDIYLAGEEFPTGDE